jgi:putative MATE family efflux protein
MLFQTLYLLVDMYFVAHLGEATIAGVSTAGTAMFVIMALTQMLGVGTVALVSHAVGAREQAQANLIFNQSVTLSAICGVATLIGGWLLGGVYVRSMAADAATAAAGTVFLYYYTPGLALQFALVALGSALRGTGIVQPTMVVQVLTVLLNTGLAPVLIAGWGTHHPLGAAGAGLASSIAVAAGVVILWIYFARLEHYVKVDRSLLAPRAAVVRRILNVGLPAGGEFLMMFVIIGIIYWVIRSFGPAAQAGFGIGGRVMQALFLQVMAVAFAAPGSRARTSVRASTRACARPSAPRRCFPWRSCSW